MIDLGYAALAAPSELVPAARAAVEDLPRYLQEAGYYPTGLTELREAVAETYTARGLATSPEQIMVTSGTQHALDLVLRLLVPAGASVLVESPTYASALSALAARRARISTHGLATAGPAAERPTTAGPVTEGTDGGWDRELLLTAFRQDRPRHPGAFPAAALHPAGGRVDRRGRADRHGPRRPRSGQPPHVA